MARFNFCQLRQLRILLVLAGVTWPNIVVSAEITTVDLTVSDATDVTKAKAVLEVDGTLISDRKNQEPVTLKAVGNFLYEEKVLDRSARRTMRYYEQAEAEISINGVPKRNELRATRRYILVDSANTIRMRALEGGLSREEAEMIELPGGSHVIEDLLPGRSVKVGETWGHEDDLMAQLLNLDTVNGNDVKTQLSSVDGRTVRLETEGKVLGAVDGSTTQIELTAKLRFDLDEKRITWAALGIKEDREASVASPGLKVRARLRLLREPTTGTHLSTETVQSLLAADSASEPLEYRSDSGYRLTHERRWHLYREHTDLTVFRLLEDDRVIAHCSMRLLSPMPIGQQLELVDFQKDVREALGSAGQQIVDASEGGLPNNTRQLRVAVIGEASGVPIHWIYYHLDNAQNRRLSCVFTMNATDVEQFAAFDATFVSGINLDPPEDEPADEEEEIDEVALKP